jgi:(4S)-4-hydroxy-5-phosphonooxypentane-2,3-dione isomerase
MKTRIVILSIALLGYMSSCTTKPKVTEEKKACCADSASCKAANNSKIIAAKIYIKPEKVTEFTTLFKGMTEKTLAEPGCTGYQLYQNPYENTTFLVFETYKNQAAIDAHFAAVYFKEFGEKVGPLVTKPSEITIFDVAAEVKK